MQNRLKALFALCLAALLLGGCTAEAPAQTGAAPGSASSAQSRDAKGEQPLPPLTLLMQGYGFVPDNAHGFYSVDIVGDPTQQHLLFYDYEALQQRYVCDVAGCAHNTPDCGSYVSGGGGSSAFAYGDSLYVYQSHYEVNPNVSALEKRDLDGKNPEVMFTWPRDEGWLECLFTDGAQFYLVLDRTLVRLDMESYTHDLVVEFPLPTQTVDSNGYMISETSTEVLPASYQGQLLCRRLNQDGTGDLFLTHPATGQETLLHTWPASSIEGALNLPYAFTPEGKGYYTEWTSGNIRCYDIATDADVLVTDFYAAENTPFQRTMPPRKDGVGALEETMYPARWMELNGPYDGWLFVTREVVTDPDSFESERKMSAYHVDTGEVSEEIPFRYYSNASTKPPWIWGDTPHGLLVVNETRPITLQGTNKDGTPYTWESDYSVFSLIDTEDFVAGRPNFRTIVPTVYGG